jgi:hypothetical protein
MSEENKAIARSYLRWAQESGDVAALDELIAPGYVRHASSQPEIVGREALKELLRAYQGAFAGMAMSIEDQIAEADKVVTRWSGVARTSVRSRALPPAVARCA